jgi:hypothetical protein
MWLDYAWMAGLSWYWLLAPQFNGVYPNLTSWSDGANNHDKSASFNKPHKILRDKGTNKPDKPNTNNNKKTKYARKSVLNTRFNEI